MVTIAYAHDGNSVYDELFLQHLTESNRTYFLTFNAKPHYVVKQAVLVEMQEPCPLFRKFDLVEGLRMYALFPLRALILKLHLRHLKSNVTIGCMATKYGFYSALAGAKPLIVIVWGSDVLVTPRRLFFFRFLAKYALRKADAVIVDSRVQERATILLGCQPEKVVRFPWFKLKNANPQRSRDEIRKQLGWDDKKIVFSARGHEPIYGLEYLIDAIPEIIKKEPASRFLVLGEGSLTEKLKQRTEELQISKYVRFVGRLSQTDTLAYLNASDINVSTSFSDGTSASLLEAMTLSVPSVVTQIPGNREWIEDGKNGFLVPVRDSHSLAEKIIFLAENNELKKKIGESARKTVESRINWDASMKTFDKLIQRLAKRL